MTLNYYWEPGGFSLQQQQDLVIDTETHRIHAQDQVNPLRLMYIKHFVAHCNTLVKCVIFVHFMLFYKNYGIHHLTHNIKLISMEQIPIHT